MKTYRYALDDDGRTYLLDNKGRRIDFGFEVEEGRPVFSLKIPENLDGPLYGGEPAAIIRYVNDNICGVIIYPFDV